MPSFPQPGSVSICEINRDIITVDSLSDERANETYSKLLGTVFGPLPFHPDQVFSWRAEQNQEQLRRRNERSLIAKALRLIQTGSLDSSDSLAEVDIQGVSWHLHKHVVALMYGRHQVMVHDYEDQAEGKDECILASESQREVRALQWRPNGGRSLAVACKGGICIWAASYPGNVASARSSASYSGTLFRGSGTRWFLVDFLQSEDEQIDMLSWSPDGRYLASASHESSSFTVWDVAQGIGTPIRRGLGGITLLKWSPTGDYFFAAKFDGTFYLWETNTWTSEPWSSTTAFVTGAAWDPEGGRILISFSGSSTLASIHFASKPPSLDAHLLPVNLPELVSLGSRGIERLAWDACGERLAVSFKGGEEAYEGLVAIYDTRRTPLISASLIGFIRGPGKNPKPIAFSFHNKFRQGPLLSVCWSSGFCCTYPLILRSQGLP